ncbi:MAG: cellulase family glycosylhydrolase, partial [Pirellulales bacterium]|nr:cellulase family glycosylhydrolase [Pirellulales bacterium]
MINKLIPVVAAAIVLLGASRGASAGQACEEVAPPGAASTFLRVEGDRFVDAEGRQVLLHGMNVISKSKQEGYLSWHRREDFAKMRAWGMNCVRLGILWDAVEPKPGQYDDAYLDRVAQRVAWAADHGLFVILDMHQDLYSVRYGNGAPDWATLDEGKSHKQGSVWSDAYLVSPAVQTAFDNFWANAPTPDGIGIQDHYAAAWRHVAGRFADCPNVLGYDLMNEPFQGSTIKTTWFFLFQGKFGAELIKRLGRSVRSPDQVAELWTRPEIRNAVTEQLDDLELYKAFLDAQAIPSRAFERRHLQPMYQRVARAIRAVDPRHVLLLEPSGQCNAGVPSALEPVVGSDGKPDPRQAYAPHAYDIVVDTPSAAKANVERLELIFNRHCAAAKRLGVPLIIGEWGAFGDADARILPIAQATRRQLEKRLCGDTYWEYGAAMEKKTYFNALKRPIPSRIAGTLLDYASDPASGRFTCRWRENEAIHAPTIVYLTEHSFQGRTVRLEPRGPGFQVEPAAKDSADVYLS